MDNCKHTLHKRHISFIYSVIHHDKYLTRSILRVKLSMFNSVYAENCRYLSYKYQISNEDWDADVSFVVGNVKLRTDLSLNTETLHVLWRYVHP